MIISLTLPPRQLRSAFLISPHIGAHHFICCHFTRRPSNRISIGFPISCYIVLHMTVKRLVWVRNKCGGRLVSVEEFLYSECHRLSYLLDPKLKGQHMARKDKEALIASLNDKCHSYQAVLETTNTTSFQPTSLKIIIHVMHFIVRFTMILRVRRDFGRALTS